MSRDNPVIFIDLTELIIMARRELITTTSASELEKTITQTIEFIIEWSLRMTAAAWVGEEAELKKQAIDASLNGNLRVLLDHFFGKLQTALGNYNEIDLQHAEVDTAYSPEQCGVFLTLSFTDIKLL